MQLELTCPTCGSQDKLWSFVDQKVNKQWVWLALDADTREIIGCYIGDCSRESAKGYGNRYLPCTGNVPLSTQTIGKLMRRLFHRSVIEHLVKIVG